AREYVYIMTPYLILDSELEHAIQFAAERGVDVRIIMPGIPDKPIPYALAKTYYQALTKSGVKIYEYTPGFVHSKIFLSDNTKAVVGTINLDYRSLYHHFECAVYLYKVDAIQDIYRDYMDTLNKSRLVSLKDINNIPKFQKVI
ncbi:cardiolipin synthase, partial [Streptococcus agalactiae]|nr:cardiolipin synthase [Streptococcus agalactiae]